MKFLTPLFVRPISFNTKARGRRFRDLALKHLVLRDEYLYGTFEPKKSVILRTVATKNLLLPFLFCFKKFGEGQKQMLHGVYPEIAEGFSMTQRHSPDGLLLPLCALIQDIH
jgi:hypothetical protein